MDLFGHKTNEIESDARLSELILAATETELRMISKFLTHCADEMGRMGVAYDHIHLSDWEPQFKDSPHFVVVRK
jgi:hypothetical protein